MSLVLQMICSHKNLLKLLTTQDVIKKAVCCMRFLHGGAEKPVK